MEPNVFVLDKIVEGKKEILEIRKKETTSFKMREMGEALVNSSPLNLFYDALKKENISIIGEFKKASPSLGNINSKIDLSKRIDEYNEAVDAISCLTEENYFKGSSEDLINIRSKTKLPIIRKDFMIDEYQFYEAKVIGANAVLLIVAILDDYKLKNFYELARSLNLDVLVETHDEYEVERALKINPRIIGVNNRNLKDFSISLENSKRLREYIPSDKVMVSESGIMNEQDVKFLKDINVDAFLIGRALMEADSPKNVAKLFKEIR